MLRCLTLTILCAACATSTTPDGVGSNTSGILEIDVATPSRPDMYPRLYMVAHARRPPAEFELGWNGTQLPGPEFDIDRGGTYRGRLAVDDLWPRAHLKLQFCRSPDCNSLEDDEFRADPQGEIWFTLDQPFYEEVTTGFRAEVVALPTCMDEGCSITSPPPASLGDCTAVSGLEFPVWSCQVERCDITCQGILGSAPGGSCEGGRDLGEPGRAGLHFCDVAP